VRRRGDSVRGKGQRERGALNQGASSSVQEVHEGEGR
jgi:hypothetical protein